MDLEPRVCLHRSLINKELVDPQEKVCVDCAKIGGTWIHLRMCLICGHVGCCDASENKHASKHFSETQHTLMKSLEPGENWKWCYLDEVMLDETPPES